MATKKFQTLNDYCNYVNKQLEKCMDEVGRQMKVEVQNLIFEKIYRTRNPKEYERTFNFLNSIQYKFTNNNGKFQVEVYYDTDLIKAEYNEYSYWNQHMSLSGEDVSKDIPYYMEYGNKSPIYSYEGAYIMKEMKEYAEQNYAVKLATLLHQRGIKIG